MSCGCGTSSSSGQSCGTKVNGCANVDTCGNSYKLNVFDWLSGISSPQKKEGYDMVEVRFKNERKSFFRNIHNLQLYPGAIVAVEAASGHDIGVVSLTGELVKIQMERKKYSEEIPQKIYRIATQKDVEIWQDARKRENSIKTEAKKIASLLGLDMKITDVEFQGDGGKATFYYTADNRVDFRQLIKDYALAFRTKIDMKQIGFRQEASKIGGIGSCGRELCCSSWLSDFRSVNTNAARYQQLSINPQKLAGQCGKLKCCLNFELDSYLDALSDFPSTSTTIETEKGKAFCIKIDVFKRKMWFAYAENPLGWYDLDVKDVKKILSDNKKGIKSQPLEDMLSSSSLSAVSEKPVDLIQENRVDRFERKNHQNRKNNNNRKQSPSNRSNSDENKRELQTKEAGRNLEHKNIRQGNKSQHSSNNHQPKNKKNFRKKPNKPNSSDE